jgi:hypothetical protein
LGIGSIRDWDGLRLGVGSLILVLGWNLIRIGLRIGLEWIRMDIIYQYINNNNQMIIMIKILLILFNI